MLTLLCRQWIFYGASTVTACMALILLSIRESRPSVLLQERLADLDEGKRQEKMVTFSSDTIPGFCTFIKVCILRPLRMFLTEPIVFFVSVISAVARALVYLFTSVVPRVYASMGLSESQNTLPFMFVGLGLIFGTCTRLYDCYKLDQRRQHSRLISPEDKLTGFQLGAPALAVGLWWFAWTIPPIATVGWVIPSLSLTLVGFALNEFDCVLAGYIADCYKSYAASGIGALALTRSLLSATFTLFAEPMFQSTNVTYNVAASILAAVATLFCAVPPVFARYGGKIRRSSKLADMQTSKPGSSSGEHTLARD